MNKVPSLCDFSRCVLSCIRHLKPSEQCLHEYGLASVWIRIWQPSSLFVLNSFPQKWQSYGLLLLCRQRVCRFNCPNWLKLLLHSEHLCGFSPVWTLMWVFRFPEWLNALSHTWHLYGFCPVWILLCPRRTLDFVNRLPHSVHKNGFSASTLVSNITELPTHAQHSRHTCAHVANTYKQWEMTRSSALDYAGFLSASQHTVSLHVTFDIKVHM